MRIAYVCLRGAINTPSWLGNAAFLAESLSRTGLDVDRIDISNERFPLLFKGVQFVNTRLLGRNYTRHREPVMLRHYAEQIEARLSQRPADVVVGLTSMAVARLECEAPIVFIGDAPFAALVDFYPTFTNLTARSIRNGHAMEMEAHGRCALAIYSSAWGARAAIDAYGVDPTKIRVVDFGANVPAAATPVDAQAALRRKPRTECRLLWLGVDWARKGGDLAVEVAERLNRRGLPTTLVVAGCVPNRRLPPFVRCDGFVERAAVAQLLTESHFLLLPSRADCSPIVFSEASAFGVPSLASDVGGIGSVIVDEKNGKVFGLQATADDYAEYLAGVFNADAEYRRLVESTLAEHRLRLNWDVAAAKIATLLTEVSRTARERARSSVGGATSVDPRLLAPAAWGTIR